MEENQTDMKLETVIFDMDGVIVDSEMHWKKAEKSFLHDIFPDVVKIDHDSFTGLSLQGVYELCRNNGMQLSKDDFCVIYENQAELIYRNQVSLYSGVLHLLCDLKKNRIKTGLASSSPMSWINMVLKRFDLEKYFDCIVSSDHTRKGKPEPDIYRYALKKLEADTVSTLAIEDSRNGITAAEKCGIFCLGFQNGSNTAEELENADLIISSIPQSLSDLEKTCRNL